jgi:hypothetical protein
MRPRGRPDETSNVSHAETFLRDAFARTWVRYPNCAGTPRAQGCFYDYDLYACAEPAGNWSEESVGLKRAGIQLEMSQLRSI